MKGRIIKALMTVIIGLSLLLTAHIFTKQQNNKEISATNIIGLWEAGDYSYSAQQHGNYIYIGRTDVPTDPLVLSVNDVKIKGKQITYKSKNYSYTAQNKDFIVLYKDSQNIEIKFPYGQKLNLKRKY